MSSDDVNPFASPRTPDAAGDHREWPLAATEFADIEPVPEPYRGRVFTGYHVLMINVIGFSPAVFFFGGGALFFLGTAIVSQGHHHWPFALPAFVGGAAGVVLGAVVSFWYPLFPEDLYSRGRFRRALRLRPAPLVHPDDPEAVFVGITPRENWSGIRLEIAADMGFLAIDAEKSLVRIEADFERFRIPRGSLLDCEPECFFHPIDARTQHWLVRLVVQLESGPREILFGVSHTDGKPRTNSVRRRLATEICDRILDLRAC